MKRTTIHYDSQEYVVALEADEIKARVNTILDTGKPGWLTVNHGRGQLQIAELLVSVGVPMGLVDTSDPD